MTTALPPHLKARYGEGRTSRWVIVLVTLVIVGFVCALAFVSFTLLSPKVEFKLLAWRGISPDRVDVTFEVRRSEEADIYCVVRAQDEQHIDVGYAVVPLPRGTTYVQLTYPLRTLAEAYVVDVLACEAGAPPTRVLPPQFPPGVAPPSQPWTPSTP